MRSMGRGPRAGQGVPSTMSDMKGCEMAKIKSGRGVPKVKQSTVSARPIRDTPKDLAWGKLQQFQSAALKSKGVKKGIK